MIDIVRITDYMKEDLIELQLKGKTKDSILDELASLLTKSPNITTDKENIKKALFEREELGSTGIGKGIAIPHAKTENAEHLTIAFGISKEKIDYNAIDEEPVRIFFTFASPLKDNRIYLKVLARISRLIRSENFRTKLLNCKTPTEVIKCISEEEAI
ncbi:PTS sugar transporter subunit IIA [Fusobacterium perfoetens]|uniref:PTS sugar transporter subunit IIA n=1 Tax=Fusobacterium perfoetens TaxID=852 RepID=UPI00047F3D90|nr:PTS sugar transporter subunit IIA [Fusobacterium perfoetens]MCI6153092.1 PTS sugar transporter subunit IIA [Fusobacterium perfoetens]MDY3236904.1 PTS sugar transporter subunit IIA [Fusobacterium perfoetens]